MNFGKPLDGRWSARPVGKLKFVEVSKIIDVRGDQGKTTAASNGGDLVVHEGWCFAELFKTGPFASVHFRRDATKIAGVPCPRWRGHAHDARTTSLSSRQKSERIDHALANSRGHRGNAGNAHHA